MTKEQADKIEIDEDVIVGFSGSGGDICAEQLAKWAYRRLETWPKMLDALRFARGGLSTEPKIFAEHIRIIDEAIAKTE